MSRLKKNVKRVILITFIILIPASIFWLLSSEVTDNTDTYVYNLPFAAGSSHKVVQGYGGWFSHKNIAALDFYMPVGTAVYAAREGIVFRYKDDSNKGGILPGYKNQANYIIIKHSDGSYGCYWHLKHNGVITKKGFVQKGELIGYSGKTGFVFAPHLHFSVKKILNYDKDSFEKTKFKTTNGVLFLKPGETYQRPA
jgi:murein DD-endopeptidase MepM/ murein hydrolase activator NlpD